MVSQDKLIKYFSGISRFHDHGKGCLCVNFFLLDVFESIKDSVTMGRAALF